MKRIFNKIFDNEGFSLVELIVVIAVLAVVTVVVSPLMIEYVEKARVGTDRNTIGEVAHASEVVYVNKDMKKTGNPVELSVRIDGNGIALYGGAAGANFADEVEKIVPPEVYKYKSKTYKNSTVTITVDTNGVATVGELKGNKGAWTAADLGITNPIAGAVVDGLLGLVPDETWEEINKAIFDLEESEKQWEDMTSDEKLAFIKDKAGITEDEAQPAQCNRCKKNCSGCNPVTETKSFMGITWTETKCSNCGRSH